MDAFEFLQAIRTAIPSNIEDDGHTSIKSYPRKIEDSVRQEDSKRKEKRESQKAAKEAEKVRKQQEFKRLKAEKRKEVESKLNEIEKITGAEANFDIKSLLANWDPEKHDEMMAQMFNDDFYNDVEAEENLDDEEIHKIALEGEDLPIDKLPKNWNRKTLTLEDEEKLEQTSREVKKKMDEIIDLEHSELVGGGPRFKYRSVKADDYGIGIEDMLNLEDRELNSRVSLKKLAPYREEYDRMRYAAGGAEYDHEEEDDDVMPHKKKLAEKKKQRELKAQKQVQKKNDWLEKKQGFHKKDNKSTNHQNTNQQTQQQPSSESKKKRRHSDNQDDEHHSAPAPSSSSSSASSSSSSKTKPTPAPSSSSSTGAADSEAGLSAAQKRRLRKKRLSEAQSSDPANKKLKIMEDDE